MEFLNQNTPIHLVNGVNIPCIGYGTWQTPAGEVAAVSVRAALEAGYRHIDAASAYGNEEGVGEGIQTSGVHRDEIFLTSKLNNPDHGYEQTKRAFAESLKALKTDYLDLYLIHWQWRHIVRWEQDEFCSWRKCDILLKSIITVLHRSVFVGACKWGSFHFLNLLTLQEFAKISMFLILSSLMRMFRQLLRFRQVVLREIRIQLSFSVIAF